MSESKPPRVSVIIPTHNRAQLLRRAIDSVCEQTFDDFEIIIVDDGSTDDTAAMVQLFSHHLGDRLVYLHRSQGGSSAARNTGLAHARGEFVAFLDSDDEFRPDKLSRQIELFDLDGELGLVYSDYSFVDLAGRTHDSAFDELWPIARRVVSQQPRPGLHVCTDSIVDLLLQSYFICTIVGMVRRSVLGSEIRFLEGHWYSEEWLFYLNVARRTKVGYVDESLSIHHQQPDSVSQTSVLRNLLHQHRLLKRVRREFPECSSQARRSLKRQRYRCSQQLGWEFSRAGRYRLAVRSFADAFFARPNAASLRALLGALYNSVRHPQARREVNPV